jgi:D-alanyl-D-alanine carboxypeptidase/D-alanyl-D-alanine-endopeptidase (penicillin-binding protein 4)
VSVFTYPGAEGEAPRLRLDPPASWIDPGNKATSVTKSKHTAWAARTLGTNNITVNGDVRWATDPVDVTLHDSPGHFAHLLADRMKQAGIGPSVFRVAGMSEALPAGRAVHVVKTSIKTVLDRCNKDSYNLYAECLLKGIGHKITGGSGSWANGAAVMRMILLERLGSSTGQGIVVADGSGMSRENRVTPRLVAEWLRAVHQDREISGVFLDSLPVAGREGTMRKRFSKIDLGCEVRAKTGYLTGVSAMSGFVTNPQTGRTAIFSIITNNKPNRVPLAWIRRFEEQVVDMVDDQLMPNPVGTPKRRTVNAR